ncbi:MAG: hypothetical protein ABR530_01855 [Pyrinomonadaceae bacterium]
MRKNIQRLGYSLVSLLFIVIVIGSYVIVAQSPITGEWKGDTRVGKEDTGKTSGKLQLSFEVRTEKGHNQHGSSFDYKDLQGLTADQTQNGRVSFRLVREAGTIEAEGTFVNGKGSGTFRFTPDSNYVTAMRSRGFDFERAGSKGHDNGEAKLLSAALLNVTTALADDLKSIEIGPIDTDDLFKAAIFKVDSKFMAEMKATGYPNLKMEDLVKARIFKIDSDFVRKVNDMGFADRDFESMVKFSIFKVTPEFLAELKDEGFTKLSSEDVVQFRIFKIDRDFIRKAKSEDPNVTVQDMVQMKIGVRKFKGTN